jgi:hypothetical protein
VSKEILRTTPAQPQHGVEAVLTLVLYSYCIRHPKAVRTNRTVSDTYTNSANWSISPHRISSIMSEANSHSAQVDASRSGKNEGAQSTRSNESSFPAPDRSASWKSEGASSVDTDVFDDNEEDV